MHKKITTMAALGLFAATAASANTTILVNTDFSVLSGNDVGWIAGTNQFQPDWVAFLNTAEDTAPYTIDDRVDPSGSGFVYISYDDGESDMLENFLFQEYGAAPTNSVFETGDVIVFKGSASATKTDPGVVTRAFVKVLGYNEQGWEYQLKPEYSSFHTIGSSLEPFELSVTFPDLAVDDSPQVLQIGFEITSTFTDGVMPEGSVYFENVEGYVEGTGPEPWNGFDVDENGYANTGDWMGIVNVTHAPWVYSYDLEAYVYIPDNGVTSAGGWVYTLAQ